MHGTSGSPTGIPWQGMLKQMLEKADYDVYFPQLPDCHTPNLARYDEFLRGSGWDFQNNVIVGHSSGSTALLHLLSQNWFPKIRAAILVGTFLNEKKLHGVDWYRPGQFDNLFVETFDPSRIAKKADAFYFVHGDDDPYCDYDEARELCESVDGMFITIPGGKHLSASGDQSWLSKLTTKLNQDGKL